jgi:aryl-alcohol dehydrogenase-like predicted oxidoreductase
MECAVDCGINMFDAAEIYPVPPKRETQGRTESIIGTWLARQKKRDKVLIATKIAGRGTADWLRKDRSPSRQSPAQIREAVEASLKRLNTDYIDLYQLHWPDRPMRVFHGLEYVHLEGDGHPIPEILGVLAKLVQEGELRFIGLANQTPWGLMTFLKVADEHGLPRIVSIQNAYNLVNRTFEIGLSEVTQRESVSLLGYSPLGQGYLTGKYEGGALPAGSRKTLFNRLMRRETGQRRSRPVALARKHGLDPAQMAIAFAVSRPFVTSTIIGATTLEQLKTDIAATELKISDNLLEDINQIHLDYSNPCP